ncbi:MAG: Ldh family oxidoreductase [Bacteroidota bacterium]|jgi:LDH2 family malate/lactate/ureidoglycolate dehydrogenase
MIDTETEKTVNVKKEELRQFAINVLQSARVSPADARIIAEALLWSDLRARHPQGVSRLPIFVKRVQCGLINSPARLKWNRVAPAAEMLDAGNAFGHVAGRAAMQRAVELAKSQGVGVVTVKRSNLYGAASYFCSIAAEARCIGITCTNAVPKVAPFGGVRPVFGTNPIAFGCPTSSGVPILVDMSTSAIAGSIARSIDETGKRLPEGAALDKNGNPTTDPKDLAEGTLLPVAGAKGFGLALMVEILCGVLSGAAMSKEVGSMYSTWDKPVNTGHCFLVMDISKFQPMHNFLGRVDTMLDWVKAAAPEGEYIRFPGEIRGELAAEYAGNGIPLPMETVKPLTKLANELNVECPWRM